MRQFRELTGRDKAIEVIRWICVLPTAAFGSIVTQSIVGMVTRLGHYDLGDTPLAYWSRVFLFYLVFALVFVVAGAKMAPRHRGATAIALTFFSILLSLTIHVVVQRLAGNNVGVANYTHFAAQSTGALCGTALVFRLKWNAIGRH